MAKQRILWVDFVKIVAMIYIVLIHFFQSMIKSGYVPDTVAGQWADTVCEWMMVRLFFFCSGFLYQKMGKINNFSEWGKNFINKFTHLMMPYFLFSLITIFLKTMAADVVNTPISESVWSILFIDPIPPFWFLYVLFLLFVVFIPISDKRTEIVGLVIAVLLFLLFVFFPIPGVFASAGKFAIWFVLGMSLAYQDWLNAFPEWIKYPLLLFIPASLLLYRYVIGCGNPWMDVVMAAWGILMAIMWARFLDEKVRGNTKIQEWTKTLIRFSMPVFLMQTIFAAGCRIILNKLGIHSAAIHIIFGLIATFIGPCIAAVIYWNVRARVKQLSKKD